MTSRTATRLLLALALSALVLASGCGKPPKLTTSDSQENAQKGDPWETAAKRLRKETDLKACKNVLASLNHELTTGEKDIKPPALAPAEEEALAGLVPLHPTDRDEIRSATFSPHDAVYLAECLYLRDAARSLAIPGLSPEQLADLGFAWVCRQVILDPWLIPISQREHMGTALSPAHILRRGSGSGLERMYVFLALLQQMGLKGCLIGPPSAAANPATYIAFAADKKTVLTGAPRGPFWAVGVRVERGIKPDIKLYDPWRGEALPVTWNELRSNPGSQTAWFDDPATVSGIRPDDLKTASVCLAVPVNSLSPRMAMMEKKLKEQVDVKLGVNPEEYRTAFAEAKPAFWNPPGDNFAYGRAARAFLPIEQGGEADRFNPAGQALYREYIRAQLPAPERLVPGELLRNQDVLGDVKERIQQRVMDQYYVAYILPPTPREQVQRGQFQDASKTLVQRQDEFGKSLLRVRNTQDSERKIREWAERATELYKSLGSDPNARALIDDHWSSQGTELVVDRAVGEVGQAEATLLLALCRHEQAERVQARLDHATGGDSSKLKQAAADAWNNAHHEWSGYREQFSTIHSDSPSRTAHVRVLAERAKKLAGKR